MAEGIRTRSQQLNLSLRKENEQKLRTAVALLKVQDVRRILESGLSPNNVDSFGWTLLHVAAYHSRDRMMRLLLEFKGDPCIPDKIAHFTCLHYASMNGKTRMAKLILEYDEAHTKQGLVNQKGKEGLTALHLAVRNGHTACVRLLLQHHADVNAKSTEEITPLVLAIVWERIGCLKMLINWSADIDTDVGLPLQYSIMKGRSHCTKMLLQHGANPNLKHYEDGQAPLHIAAMKDDLNTCVILYAYGADCVNKNEDGLTPVAVARQRSSLDRPCLQYLTEVSRNPRSLQDMCRIVIRNSIGKSRLSKINSLPLCRIMLEYLSYKFDG
ncbi:ankyrin repeat and SOCS box protein 7-like [Anneissia japonica]|uniref:ankyrin repeat and SOCS box protein 7-like n=1 Tax=Anneissia japonica TaxID=1529436 RepID=UPI0014254DAC|nr:ankyrin repeat and SOCS box protein 7-like [Anneissia japonica]XP_033107498.1 ankyrin repeat and SOCS box protein 7-like [Anneissia japonica]